MGLGRADGLRQLANAKLRVALQKHQTANAGIVSQGSEEIGRRDFHRREIYGMPYISSSEYITSLPTECSRN